MSVTFPEIHDFDLGDQPGWERRAGERTKCYAAFRIYRDLPPAQRLIATVAERVGISPRQCATWANDYDWRERAAEWDDACHHIEDQERLEAIRSMHALHRRAGRAAMSAALRALSNADPENMPINAVARLMELGARLERSTLLTSVEELQGIAIEDDDSDDPWERIARELDPRNAEPEL